MFNYNSALIVVLLVAVGLTILTLPGVNAQGFLDQPVNLPVDVATNE